MRFDSVTKNFLTCHRSLPVSYDSFIFIIICIVCKRGFYLFI